MDLSFHSNYATILLMKRGFLGGLLQLSSCCRVIHCVLYFFLAVTLVDLRCVIVAFLRHTHLFFSFVISFAQHLLHAEILYGVNLRC